MIRINENKGKIDVEHYDYKVRVENKDGSIEEILFEDF